MSQEFKHVLVPVDFSEDAERAMEAALSLFSNAETITLITVCETISNRHAEMSADINEIMTKNTQKETQSFLEKYQGRHKNILSVIKKGHASTQILAAAKDLDVDLIVMGSQGRSSIARVFFGSTTYDVSRKASCSIFVIRA
ncbi:MAG: universal stress protein E [Kiritimatiellia bacterium]|jgi:universal stress protein E